MARPQHGKRQKERWCIFRHPPDPGAIGYTEYGFAKLNKLPTACLENKAGKFVCPGPEGGAAALANVLLPENMIVFINDPAGDASYPIATFTWMLFYKKTKASTA